MAKKSDAVVIPLFRRGADLEGVPEVEMITRLGQTSSASTPSSPRSAVDLSGRPHVWLLIGPGGVGKTAAARWLVHQMIAEGRGAVLAALDPGNRSLASWFDDVQMPDTKGGVGAGRWLREFLDYLMTGRQSAIIDLGGGDLSLETLIESTGNLHGTLEAEGIGLVACYVLSPRLDDLHTLQTLENAGFQPTATLIVLNEGKADPIMTREEAFGPMLRHSVFRAAVARGAMVAWMPPLDFDIMQEIEVKRLSWVQARDGGVPDGATFSPLGGLRRSAVSRWLQMMGEAFAPCSTWLP